MGIGVAKFRGTGLIKNGEYNYIHPDRTNLKVRFAVDDSDEDNNLKDSQ